MKRLAAYLALTPAAAMAAEGAPPAFDAGTIFQMLGSLALVLGLIIALAWLLRRLGNGPGGSSGLLRVVGSTAVGQKERVVVVELADTWLVLGVAPGQVSALYSLPRQEAAAQAKPEAPAPFAQWLKQAVAKHDQDRA